MSSEDVMSRIAAEQGWNTESQLCLCLQYIENQQDNAGFAEFLRTQADDEKEGELETDP